MHFIAVILLMLCAERIYSQYDEKGERIETLLIDDIFKNYDKRSRPVKYYHTPVVVNFSLYIQQILQVDEKHQVITLNLLRGLYWNDDFLKWKPENYGNITYIIVEHSKIWSPDVTLYNSAAFDKDETNGETKTKNVNYHGNVVEAQPMIVKSTCKIDVTWFPFDEQKCFLIFGSWSTSSKYLFIQVTEYSNDATEFIPSGEWELLAVTAENSSTTYSCCPDEPFMRVTYTIHLKRRAFYYFFNLLVPCGLIGFLAVLGFTLPPESGEKLPLGASILFSLIVFLNTISQSMPANSDAVPLLATYFNCVMFTIALSVISTIVVNLKLKAANHQPMNGLTKKLFLYWLPWFLQMTVSPNIIAEKPKPSKTTTNIGDTITLHFDRSFEWSTDKVHKVIAVSLSSEGIVAQQWKFIAVVVDRLCFVLSLMYTLVSLTVFLVYAF